MLFSRGGLMGVTILALAASSQAGIQEEGIRLFDNIIHVRQAGTGVSSAASATPSPSAAPSSTPAGSSQNSPSPTPAPSSQSPSPSPSPSPGPSNSASPSQSPSGSPSPTPGSSSERQDTTTTASSSPPSSTPLVTSRTVRTVFSTVVMSGSQSVLVPVTSDIVAAVTTGFATPSASLQAGSENGASKGMSSSTKKIIGGVVGGIGGAILLGAIAVVFWRLRLKKRNQAMEEDDYLSGAGEPLRAEKRRSDGGNAAFQNTLDQYHNPAGKPNAAANF